MPIPGYPANFGALRVVLLPEDLDKDKDEQVGGGSATDRSSSANQMGAGVDTTNGIVAGFSLNMDNQVVEMSDSAQQSMMRGGYAFWRGRKHWKLRQGMVSFFVDSDVPLLLDLLHSLRVMDHERGDDDETTSHAAEKQLSFLQDTLQSVRKRLSDDENGVPEGGGVRSPKRVFTDI